MFRIYLLIFSILHFYKWLFIVINTDKQTKLAEAESEQEYHQVRSWQSPSLIFRVPKINKLCYLNMWTYSEFLGIKGASGLVVRIILIPKTRGYCVPDFASWVR